MYYEIVVVPDAEMPGGQEWIRVTFAEDHVATFFSETFAAANGRRVLCEDGIPVARRSGSSPRPQPLPAVVAIRASWPVAGPAMQRAS